MSVKKTNPNDAEVKGKQLMLLIQTMIDVADVIWEKKNYDQPRERFYYTIFMKLLYILDGIHVNIFNLDEKPHYNLVAALSLRTAMLDILNLYYVMDVHEETKNAESRINAIMADQLKNTYGNLTSSEKEEVRNKWPELFDEQNSLRDFGRVNTKQLIKGIFKVENLKKEAEDAHHVYNIFSKYEHNGAFTFDLLHNPYRLRGIVMTKYMIYYAISSCAIACKIISSHWVATDDPLATKIDASIRPLTEFNSPKKQK